MNTLGQAVGCIAWLNRYHCLYDQGAAIEFLGDEVYAATMLRVARFQCPLVGVQPFVLGQQRRVDVEQAAW